MSIESAPHATNRPTSGQAWTLVMGGLPVWTCALTALFIEAGAWRWACGISALIGALGLTCQAHRARKARWQWSDAATHAHQVQTEVAQFLAQVHDKAQTLRQDVTAFTASSGQMVNAATLNENRLVNAAQATMDLSMAIQDSTSAVGNVRTQADTTLDTARQGESMVEQAAMSIQSINETSAQVKGLIQTIETIAFQTNILALNAAVEAARAGESGRGFAVVAGEVRQLAHRTTQAATEVKRVIGMSVDELEGGTALMQEAGEMMRVTVEKVHVLANELTRLDISVSTQRQQVENINHSLIEVHEFLSSHTQTVQETAGQVQQFDEQAQQLITHSQALMRPVPRHATAI